MLEMMGHTHTRPTWIADNAACVYLVVGAGMYNLAKHTDTPIYRVRVDCASSPLVMRLGRRYTRSLGRTSLPTC